MPSTVLVYELQSGTTGSGGATLQLLSVLLFASSVSSVAWRPASTAAGGAGGETGQGEAQPQLSIVSSSSPAIYLWTAPPSSLPQHDREAEPAAPIVEGVPVPVPAAPLSATSSSHSATAMDFRPSGLRWSPDGAKVAVASAREGATGGGGMGGLSVLIIPLKDTPGVKTHRLHTSGMHASGSTFVLMDNVMVPAANLIGRENEGFQDGLLILSCRS